MKVSIIIPTFNEADNIECVLNGLHSAREAGHEIIVADGGSTDNTAELARPLADLVLVSAKGRALQMNAGALAALGDVFVFLHADTRLDFAAIDGLVHRFADTGKVWGRFNVRLSGTRLLFRIIERLMNWRSCLTGIATGDQAMFMTRQAFADAGGFPNIELMEDVALSRTLKAASRPLCLRGPVITSSRRWEKCGVMKTIVMMWQLRLAYFFGASPAALARKYDC